MGKFCGWIDGVLSSVVCVMVVVLVCLAVLIVGWRIVVVFGVC